MHRQNIQLLAFIILFITAVKNTHAQQEPLITQFWNAQNYFNPATV